mmetsp:Transcript_12457/g.50101  ORF Transcript_12457/g.50101 Transcript_12457/m.50101 type:complete len:241 (-) Transcript_12457:150-872(-)
MPSFWSSVAKSEKNRRRSRRTPSASESSKAALTPSLHMATEGCDLVAMSAAISTALLTSSSTGYTRATNPAASASSASIMTPVRHISIALDLPTARTSRCVPPAPGMMPRLISGWPNLALAPATMRSHIIASSQPPPSAKPLTAAMMGFFNLATSPQSPRRSFVYVSGYVRPAISLMSAPAAKAFSEPVRTIAPTAASWSKALAAALTSATSGEESALSAFGRFSVMSPTAPRCSAVMNS